MTKSTGIGRGGVQRAQTHCRNGHPLSGDNIQNRTNGRRVCKACHRLSQRARYKPRSAPKRVPVDGQLTCGKCRQAKPAEAFRYYRGGWGGKCKRCVYDAQAERCMDRREYIDGLKLSTGCADCGYNAASVALEFDHRPGTLKLCEITRFRNGAGTWDQMLAEIAKCEIVCSNCHRIRTFTRPKEPVKVERRKVAHRRILLDQEAAIAQPVEAHAPTLFEAVS